jgi:hypothetical protein
MVSAEGTRECVPFVFSVHAICSGSNLLSRSVTVPKTIRIPEEGARHPRSKRARLVFRPMAANICGYFIY